MGVPLADVDGVAVGRGAREPADADRAAGAADIFHDHWLASEARTLSARSRRAADIFHGHRLGSAPPILSARIRAATSVDPPGGNGTIRVIGREGKLSACAEERSATTLSAMKTNAAANFRIIEPRVMKWRSRIVVVARPF